MNDCVSSSKFWSYNEINKLNNIVNKETILYDETINDLNNERNEHDEMDVETNMKNDELINYTAKNDKIKCELKKEIKEMSSKLIDSQTMVSHMRTIWIHTDRYNWFHISID